MPVRHAKPGDALGIGRVHVASWQAAYRGVLAQDDLDSLDPAQRGANWRRYLNGPLASDESVFIAEVQPNTVLGFASVGQSRDANGVGELRCLYVSPEHWGQGVGGELLSSSIDALVACGFREATLWVLDSNDRARRFYEANGWAVDQGVKQETIGKITVREVRYRRALA
ncbi:GNAT family N-acetyltransferase [Ferrimicrobium sp.]|uniref:GNAT family N-acetyltransferase n=1 Tax=Ferrimicrobium sp. TaxID=2926050 RepID=UPI00262EA769|nr:GNAT family N-acetyltransferase [Ferrimicrobium sp.]